MDYRLKGRTKYKTMQLDTHEFIRRFMLDVLPCGFHRIQLYGLLASQTQLALARRLLNVAATDVEPPLEHVDDETAPFQCCQCHQPMVIVAITLDVVIFFNALDEIMTSITVVKSIKRFGIIFSLIAAMFRGSVMSKESENAYQSERNVIRWKLHFSSPPSKVYEALSTAKGRRGYWAESAEEHDGKIHYVFLNGIENTGEILERIPGKRFSVMYFSWKTTFNLSTDGTTGTDMEMISENIPESEKMEISAGWVSWLMAMKASVDFRVDLRNHDSSRTWFDDYVDN